MSLSPLHIIVVLLLVLLLFGTGKLPRLMGDLAEGIKAFKKGMKDEKGERGTGDGGANERGNRGGTQENGRQISPPDIDHEPVETSRRSEDRNDQQRHDHPR